MSSTVDAEAAGGCGDARFVCTCICMRHGDNLQWFMCASVCVLGRGCVPCQGRSSQPRPTARPRIRNNLTAAGNPCVLCTVQVHMHVYVWEGDPQSASEKCVHHPRAVGPADGSRVNARPGPQNPTAWIRTQAPHPPSCPSYGLFSRVSCNGMRRGRGVACSETVKKDLVSSPHLNTARASAVERVEIRTRLFVPCSGRRCP